MCRHHEHSLPCDMVAAREARRLCGRWLREAVGASPAALDCIEVASLVISELVTNAIKAGCQNATVVVDVHRHRVRVGATDDAAGLPKVQQPPATDGHGRGLQIVERLSVSWGVSPAPAGKHVWADVSVPSQLTADLRCSLPDLE